MTARHPDQPLINVKGAVHFKKNPIVIYLLDNGGVGVDMNHLARLEFSDEDRQQFAQLIGYSLSGYGELSYVSDEAYERAFSQLQPIGQPEEANKASINWDLCPAATHFSYKPDNSGIWADVFWKVVDHIPVTAWQVQSRGLIEYTRPSYTGRDIAQMIPRPTPELDAAKRDAAIQALTNLMLDNPDLNQYFLARLIVDAGYSKKESP